MLFILVEYYPDEPDSSAEVETLKGSSQEDLIMTSK